MESDGGGECSITIKELLTFTLPQEQFVQRSSTFSACVFVPPCFIVVGSKGGSLYRWAIPDKLNEHTLYPDLNVPGHLGVVSCLHWSNSLELLFSGSSDRKVLVWNITTKAFQDRPIQTIAGFEGTPIQIETYRNLLFVVESKGVKVFQQQCVKDTNGSVFIFKKVDKINEEGVNKIVVFTNSEVDDNGIVFCALNDGTIVQYDMQLAYKTQFTRKSTVRRVATHGVSNIIFNPLTGCLFSFAYIPTVRIFNPKENILLSLENPHNKIYTNGCCTRLGVLMLLDVSGNLYIYDAQEKITLLYETKLESGGYGIFPAMWTHDTQDKLLYLLREKVTLFGIDKGTVKISYKVHNKNVIYTKSLCNEGENVLVTVGEDKFIKIWDPADFSLRREYKIPTHLALLSAVVDVRKVFASNILWAITGHDDGKVIFFNLTDEKIVELPSKHKNSISALSVSNSQFNSTLFSCDYDGYVSAWMLESIFENISFAAIALIRMWKAHDKEILACASTNISDSVVVATGGNDKVIKVWEDKDGNQVVHELLGHTDSVTSLCFDGFFLFSGSEDFTIRVWDTYVFVQLQVISTLHISAVRNVFVIPNESAFASCDSKGAVFIYDYTKRKVLFEHHHSNDCKAVYYDSAKTTLYACVKKEIVPHKIQREAPESPGLPPLRP